MAPGPQAKSVDCEAAPLPQVACAAASRGRETTSVPIVQMASVIARKRSPKVRPHDGAPISLAATKSPVVPACVFRRAAAGKPVVRVLVACLDSEARAPGPPAFLRALKRVSIGGAAHRNPFTPQFATLPKNFTIKSPPFRAAAGRSHETFAPNVVRIRTTPFQRLRLRCPLFSDFDQDAVRSACHRAYPLICSLTVASWSHARDNNLVPLCLLDGTRRHWPAAPLPSGAGTSTGGPSGGWVVPRHIC